MDLGQSAGLGSVKVDEKSNEITAIPTLLAQLELAGCMVSIDAMGCQTAIARQIKEQDGEYVFGLKGNQGTLHREVEESFTYAQATQFAGIAHDYQKTVDKAHGRLEMREYWTIFDPDYIAYFDADQSWKGLRSSGMVRSQRRIGEQITQETRYYIMSLSGSAKTFARAVRGHWGIEDYHPCLKSGCRIEERQLKSVDGLIRRLGSVVPAGRAGVRRCGPALVKTQSDPLLR